MKKIIVIATLLLILPVFLISCKTPARDVLPSETENDFNVNEINKNQDGTSTITAYAMDKSDFVSNELSEEDKNVLKYYREPTIDDDFMDNVVKVIFKSGFREEIGFEEFGEYVNVSNIYSITYKLNSIYQEDNEKLTIFDNKNAIFVLTLTTHDKSYVLEVIQELKEWNDVLVAEPDYFFQIENYWVHDDDYYN